MKVDKMYSKIKGMKIRIKPVKNHQWNSVHHLSYTAAKSIISNMMLFLLMALVGISTKSDMKKKAKNRGGLLFHKGQILSVWTTVLVTVVGVVAVIIVMMFYIWASSIGSGPKGGPMTYTEINAYNHPYSVAEILTHYRPGDRNVIEQAIESSVAGSLEKSQSQDLERNLKLFMDSYSFSYHEIAITNTGEVMRFDNAGIKCGADYEGICTSKYDVFAVESGTGSIAYCNIGRIEINGMCLGQNMVCCKDVCEDPNSAECQSNKAKWGDGPGDNVIKCGSEHKGTCSARSLNPKNWWEPWRFYESSYKDICGEGRSIVKTNDCNTKISAPLCCNKIGEAETEEGLLTSAIIPLLYKDSLGYMTVTVNAK